MEFAQNQPDFGHFYAILTRIWPKLGKILGFPVLISLS
jgi:hypothetical protein